jgi:hypothetical protein
MLLQAVSFICCSIGKKHDLDVGDVLKI